MLRIVKLTLAILILSTTGAHAEGASAILNISVNLVQCGQTQADLPRACRADSRCCGFEGADASAYIHQTDTPNWKARMAEKQHALYKYMRKAARDAKSDI